jgi:ribose transport system ATP-binding protein
MPLLEMRGIRKVSAGTEVLHRSRPAVGAAAKCSRCWGKRRGQIDAHQDPQRRSTRRTLVRYSLDGEPADFRSPRDEAQRAGIRVIYQELNDAPTLSAAENVLLGRSAAQGLDRHRLERGAPSRGGSADVR